MMIKYVTGNILNSDAEALVNTVNCEGYMGKGIAYQFKLKYPDNNEAYKKACNRNEVKTGKILVYQEKEKTIINFPTKDKWRKNSKYSYIENGMKDLISRLPDLNLKSVAIPPLGCGNGGLEWDRVREILLKYIQEVSNIYDFIIYEPSHPSAYKKVNKEPKINSSHLVLMKAKLKLNKFNKTRLQKTGFLLNVLSNEDYFKFEGQKFGPYAHSIDVLSRDIREFQKYHNVRTPEAFEIAMSKSISESVERKLSKFEPFIERAAKFVNKIESDKDLEAIATTLYIILNQYPVKEDEIIKSFNEWSKRKKEKFSNEKILESLKILETNDLISRSFYDYSPKNLETANS